MAHDKIPPSRVLVSPPPIFRRDFNSSGDSLQIFPSQKTGTPATASMDCAAKTRGAKSTAKHKNTVQKYPLFMEQKINFRPQSYKIFR